MQNVQVELVVRPLPQKAVRILPTLVGSGDHYPFKSDQYLSYTYGCDGQLETVETETGNGKWKRKTETVKT